MSKLTPQQKRRLNRQLKSIEEQVDAVRPIVKAAFDVFPDLKGAVKTFIEMMAEAQKRRDLK